MRKLALAFGLTLAVGTVGDFDAVAVHHDGYFAACKTSGTCNACKNCKYCKPCSKNGKRCSACR